jgi:cytochrome c-type biogenesis protein CcmF
MQIASFVNGNTLILIALLVSLGSLFFLARSAAGNPYYLVTARQLYYLTTMLIVLTSILLMGALVGHDFQNAYVYENTSRELPPLYIVAAFWAGNQGSFLLWLLILNIIGVAVTRVSDENQNIIMSVLVITQVFFLIIVMADSPFKAIWDVYKDVQPGFKPEDGLGMNTLLIDPWMVSHPPVLFMGYASAIVPFGYAIAALMRKDPRIIVTRSYPWILFSMISLGVGIFMGGYWAYKVLGWGGYWGWDPVENSSLVPWLVAIALVHGVILQKKKGVLARANIALSLVYFVLVFYSTFLTRSGVLSDFSVHSFADYGLSPYLASFMLFYIVIGVALFIKMRGEIKGVGLSDQTLSWESLAAYGVIVLAGFAVVVLVGTSMPLITGLFQERPTAVTENFYNNISVPFGLLILVFMVASTMVMTGQNLKSRFTIVASVFSLIAGVLFNIFFTRNPVPHVFTALSLFVIIMCCRDLFVSKSGALIASRLTHIGTALFIIGVMASGYHSTSEQKTLYLDRSDEVGGLLMTFRGMHGQEKTSLHFTVAERRGDRDIYTDYYPDPRTGSWYRAPYIIRGLAGDLYIIPLAYHSGLHEATTLLLAKDEEKTLDGFTVRFRGFRTENMTSEKPVIMADLLINGREVLPGLTIDHGSRVPLDAKIAGTSRTVSLTDMDISAKKVMIALSPGRDTVIPPDSAVVEVAHKRLIWIVWLGTIMIAAGALVALARRLRKSPA